MTIGTENHFDAVIVGARAAGSGTALCLSRMGAKVLVIDRDAYGSDRMSTHALMRSGVVQLNRWGVLKRVMDEGARPVARTTFHYADMSHSVDIRPDFGVAHLVAPRRTVLDRVLADAARDAGATVFHQTHMLDLIRNAEGRVTGITVLDHKHQRVRISADWIIGADGRTSAVAQAVGAPFCQRDNHASGTVYGYFDGVADEGFRWYFGDRAAAGVIPTNDGQSCVFASVPSAGFRGTFRGDLARGFYGVLHHIAPELAAEVLAAVRVGRFTPFSGAAGFRRQSYGPGWALVGDAGYFKDPATANGISDALRDAELLARALSRGGDRALAEYQAQRNAVSDGLSAVTDRIAACDLGQDDLRQAHKTLAKELNAQAAYVADFDAALQTAA